MSITNVKLERALAGTDNAVILQMTNPGNWVAYLVDIDNEPLNQAYGTTALEALDALAGYLP